MNLFFLFYSCYDWNELVEWVVSVLILDVLIVIFFIKFFKIGYSILWTSLTNFKLNPSINNAQASTYLNEDKLSQMKNKMTWVWKEESEYSAWPRRKPKISYWYT